MIEDTIKELNETLKGLGKIVEQAVNPQVNYEHIHIDPVELVKGLAPKESEKESEPERSKMDISISEFIEHSVDKHPSIGHLSQIFMMIRDLSYIMEIMPSKEGVKDFMDIYKDNIIKQTFLVQERLDSMGDGYIDHTNPVTRAVIFRRLAYVTTRILSYVHENEMIEEFVIELLQDKKLDVLQK